MDKANVMFVHFCAIIGGETKSGGQVYIQGYTV